MDFGFTPIKDGGKYNAEIKSRLTGQRSLMQLALDYSILKLTQVRIWKRYSCWAVDTNGWTRIAYCIQKTTTWWN